MRDKTLKGKVDLSFTILPGGRVAQPKVDKSSIDDETLLTCITRKMRRWTFPQPKNGGKVTVTYPLILKTR